MSFTETCTKLEIETVKNIEELREIALSCLKDKIAVQKQLEIEERKRPVIIPDLQKIQLTLCVDKQCYEKSWN